MDAIIGLGTNLGEREQNLLSAISRIEQHVGPVLSRSRFFETPPLVPEGSSAEGVPNYLNAAVRVETELTAASLLESLLAIERSLGRDRSQEMGRWQSRVIDLDLLSYGDEAFQSSTLTIPHPELHKRRFVLEPMAEVAPRWVHPLLKKSIAELLAELNDGA